MATTVNFSKQGQYLCSDPIEVTGNNLVIRVEFATPGVIVLERSITGNKYIYEATFNPSYMKSEVVEKGISGIVPGQFLRLRFEASEPSLITVLQ